MGSQKQELQVEIAEHIKTRIGDDFYVARDIALSMTDLATNKMTVVELTKWVEKLRRDDEKGENGG